MVLAGWPDRRQEVPASLTPYWDSRGELAVSDGVIYKGMRIVVPPSLQQHMLSRCSRIKVDHLLFFREIRVMIERNN